MVINIYKKEQCIDGIKPLYTSKKDCIFITLYCIKNFNAPKNLLILFDYEFKNIYLLKLKFIKYSKKY